MTKVRIEREVCTGSGDCARAVSDVFWLAADGLAMVKEETAYFGETQLFEDDDQGAMQFTAWARVPQELEQRVELAASNCPGACIVVEHEEPESPDEPEPPDEPATEPEPEISAEEGPTPAPARASLGGRIRRRIRRLFG